MSTKFNAIRKLRNRIFHHEAIAWNLDVVNSYKKEIIQGIEWLHIDLSEWIKEFNHIDDVIAKHKSTIE